MMKMENNMGIERVQNLQGPVNLPASLRQKLTASEITVLEMKYKAKPIGEMSEQEKDLWASALILKIHAITGWVVPEGNLLNILADQFRKKMIESYTNCNTEEIEYAFRNMGTTVKDWGKQMNLSLIDEVMIPYLEKRYQLSELENALPAGHGAQHEPAKKLTGAEMREWAEMVFDDVKKGRLNVALIPIMLYDWLDLTDILKLTVAKKREYILMATNYRKEKLEESDDPADRAVLKHLIKMIEDNVLKGDEALLVTKLAKQMAVFEFIKNHKPQDGLFNIDGSFKA